MSFVGTRKVRSNRALQLTVTGVLRSPVPAAERDR
jgi:hypothetical protein